MTPLAALLLAACLPREQAQSLGPPMVVKPARRDERWQNARCNDGSPWSYVIRRTSSPLWVVDLSGGYFCDEERLLCRDRKRPMTTTRPEPDGGRASLKEEGLFSTDEALNPTFARANHVFAHYCSSDLWLGGSLQRQPNSADPEGWWFSGRENVRALTEALEEIEHLDETDPETVILFVGTSAGGAGLVGNLDVIRRALPDAARDGRLKIVIDGGWVPPPPDDSQTPNITRWGPLTARCDAAAKAAGRDPRTCLYGPSWWPEASETGLPILVAVSGLDVAQTPAFGIDTPEEQLDWQMRVKRSLQDSAVPWVFSSATAYHTVAFEPAFRKGPAGQTFREILDRFLAGAPPERVFLRYPEESP